MQEELHIASPRRRGSGRLVLAVALLAFFAGALGMGWLAWQGSFDAALAGLGLGKPDKAMLADLPPAAASPGATSATPVTAAAAKLPAGSVLPVGAPAITTLGSVETRLALLEERLSRPDLQAEAASGNAARAEGLLIAFAARRTLDRGAPLGYLEDQLKLRFGDAQPNAVQTVIQAASRPVTMEELAGALEAAAPALTRSDGKGDAWNTVRNEIVGLFTVRRDAVHGLTSEQRIARAQLLLAAGKTEQAIAVVERMPGSASATRWLDDARRYAAARHALDLIETAAMLEPRQLQDASDRKVVQPSPLAEPAPKPLASASPAD